MKALLALCAMIALMSPSAGAKTLFCALPGNLKGLKDLGIVGSVAEGFQCRFSYIKSVPYASTVCPAGYQKNARNECQAPTVCSSSLIYDERAAEADLCQGATIPPAASCPDQDKIKTADFPFLRRELRGHDVCVFRALPVCAPGQELSIKDGCCFVQVVETSDKYLRLK